MATNGYEIPPIVVEGRHALVRRDYTRFLQLLDNGLDINYVGLNQYDHSFLLSQVYHLNVQGVRFLLENGIDPNIPDSNGLTSLDYIYRLPHLRVYSDVERLRSDMIQDILREFGGYTARAIRAGIRGDLNRLRNYRNYPRKNSNPGSNPSDPDSELMRDQAATQIQRRIRGRQSRQMRNYTRRNTGLQSLNPTMRERFRRFTDHNRMLDENDPLSGYLHDVYFPPKMTSKSSQSKSKRKVAKRTKKKRNRRNRY
jgi:hypothetical protein